MRINLVLAAILGSAVVGSVIMSFGNHIWATKLKDLQVLAAGIAALAAALVAHDGQSAAAREAKRKDDADREFQRRSALLRAEGVVLLASDQVHTALLDVYHFTDGYNQEDIHQDLYKAIRLAVPSELWEVWKVLPHLPNEAHTDVTRLTHFMSESASMVEEYKMENEPSPWGRLADTLWQALVAADHLYFAIKDESRGFPPGTTEHDTQKSRETNGYFAPKPKVPRHTAYNIPIS